MKRSRLVVLTALVGLVVCAVRAAEIAPRRIASINLSADEILSDILPPGRLVGVTRFVSGLALGGNQLWTWLTESGLEKKLFRDPRVLPLTLDRVRSSLPAPRGACVAPPKEDGWKLGLAAAPKKLCPAPAKLLPGGQLWLTTPQPTPGVAAVVALEAGTADACRPRLSAVFFDPTTDDYRHALPAR